MRDADALAASCRLSVSGLGRQTRDPSSVLAHLAERVSERTPSDRYGGGELVERLERRVAELLGKNAALFFPTGTMAQQIALRIWADRARLSTVAFHARCHLERHEHKGYEELHGLRGLLPGAPDRLLTLDDLEAIAEPVAALLIELPQRELGGRLPEWDELVAQTEWARRRDVALHLDGARLWLCPPYYGRGLDEIAALFDTVYVSLYKDLGAPGGCLLAGPADVIDEARVWRIRHGGRVFSVWPYVLAAERGLDEVLPRMVEYFGRARELAAGLAALDDLDVVPDRRRPSCTSTCAVTARSCARRRSTSPRSAVSGSASASPLRPCPRCTCSSCRSAPRRSSCRSPRSSRSSVRLLERSA